MHPWKTLAPTWASMADKGSSKTTTSWTAPRFEANESGYTTFLKGPNVHQKWPSSCIPYSTYRYNGLQWAFTNLGQKYFAVRTRTLTCSLENQCMGLDASKSLRLWYTTCQRASNHHVGFSVLLWDLCNLPIHVQVPDWIFQYLPLQLVVIQQTWLCGFYWRT